MTKKNIFNEVGFIVNNSKVKKMTPKIFGNGTPAWGLADFELRSKIIDSLVDGALVIEVHMKRLDPTEPTPPFIPDNPATCKIVQGLFLDEETADIVFEVGMRNDNEGGGGEILEITIDHDNERDDEVNEELRNESHGQIQQLQVSPDRRTQDLVQLVQLRWRQRVMKGQHHSPLITVVKHREQQSSFLPIDSFYENAHQHLIICLDYHALTVVLLPQLSKLQMSLQIYSVTYYFTCMVAK